MNDSNTHAVDPRDDGSDKAMLDPDSTQPPMNDPKAVPKANPGPDTREEPFSPK